jgi:hypothetical protein
VTARFSTITGADWRNALRSARARSARRAVFMAYLRECARRAGKNTLADSVADGAQGEPATARCVELLVAHETKAESANSAFEEGAK